MNRALPLLLLTSSALQLSTHFPGLQRLPSAGRTYRYLCRTICEFGDLRVLIVQLLTERQLELFAAVLLSVYNPAQLSHMLTRSNDMESYTLIDSVASYRQETH